MNYTQGEEVVEERDYTMVCLKGHIYSYYESRRAPADFCDSCGLKILRRCEGCDEPLALPRYVNGKPAPPTFCTGCGKPFAWTQDRLDAAEEALEMEEELTSEDKAEVRKNLPDLIQETPRTPIAASKMAKVWSKVRGPGKALYEGVVAPIVVEAAKRNWMG